MKFHFRQIPPIIDAELELADFTIISGRNNSGKTYLAYALYGLLKRLRNWPVERRHGHVSLPNWVQETPDREVTAPDWREVAATLAQTGRVTLRVSRKALAEHQSQILTLLAKDFVREQLPSVFQVREEEFADASISLSVPGADFASQMVLPYAPHARLILDYGDGVLEITARQDDGHASHNDRWLLGALLRAYTHFLFARLPRPFVLTGERLGIALFYRELDFTKNQLVELLQEHSRRSEKEDPEMPYLVVEKAASRYALPIRDNITYTRSLPDRNGGHSDLTAGWIGEELPALVNGRFTADGGELRYRSVAGADREFDVPLHRASSSARALMEFDFFVRHDARKGQLLIVDEPESHLDVHNQVVLARLLARIASSGIQVLVTTHSDYFVKEINNLISASHLGPDSAAVRELGYDQQARLPASSVRAYMTENGSLTPCAIDEYGIEIPLFENAVRQINAVSEQLAAELDDTHDG